MPPTDEVLVVGAGPTGLILALWLQRLGVRVRIIDRAAQVSTTSRALAVHARTLEFYRQFGIAQPILERGLPFSGINLWVRGRHAARIDLSDMGQGLSPFPYSLILPQDEHEKILIGVLHEAGVDVERCTELLRFEQRGDGVVAYLKRASGAEEACTTAYLAGCDGARSTVRQGMTTGFPGGTYQDVFYVADVRFRGPAANHELHVALDQADLLAIFPMKEDHSARLIGTLREGTGEEREPTWDQVSPGAIERMHIAVDQVNWFSTYHVHHRVADHFRQGRVFLLGDAAHIHSPVGGQGMNTGIGDAVNLAWKLASVLRQRAEASLLETYETERIAFAKRLVRTTDRAFTIANRSGLIARAVRMQAVPHLLPALTQRRAVRRLFFRTISQTRISYRRQAWSEGKAGAIAGGDRLPWVKPDTQGAPDNFGPLGTLDWQVHVYGEPSSGLAAACDARQLPLQAFPWSAAVEAAGLARDAAYLVRPDGHVAVADRDGSPTTLMRYLSAHALLQS